MRSDDLLSMPSLRERAQSFSGVLSDDTSSIPILLERTQSVSSSEFSSDSGSMTLSTMISREDSYKDVSDSNKDDESSTSSGNQKFTARRVEPPIEFCCCFESQVVVEPLDPIASALTDVNISQTSNVENS